MVIAYDAGAPGLQSSSVDFSKATDLNEYINPPPDSRLISILKKTGSPLAQGIIQQTDDVTAARDDVGTRDQLNPFACRFMFNPNTVNVSYQIADGVLPPGQQTADQMAATAIYPGATSIGFSLLFDRTYDVHYGPGSGGHPYDLRGVGVYADVQALEHCFGIIPGSGPDGSIRQRYFVSDYDTTTPAPSSTTAAVLPGNMLPIPAYVIFGGGNGGFGFLPTRGLTFCGYFTSMNVNYVMFNERMVPTRCSVDLTMNQLVGQDPVGFNANNKGTILDRLDRQYRTTERGYPAGRGN